MQNGNVVKALTDSIERFVRWIYPGFLLLLLLHLGSSTGLAAALAEAPLPTVLRTEAGAIFALLVFAVVASFIIYGLYRYVILDIIIEYVIFYLLLRWGPVRESAQHQNGNPPWTPLAFWRWNSRFQRSKFGSPDGSPDRHFLDYLTYSWAVTHAMGISGMMLIAALLLSEQGSVVRSQCLLVFVLAALLLGTWFWQVGNNTEGDISFV